jgi:uncharacterized protein (DUF58 family)
MALSKPDRLDWAALAPLKLRARTVADGLLTGAHRSTRRGAGVEFGGHRNYVPGDDLRFLDRRVLMRHGRLTVRVFETETERSLGLLVDASRSMGYESESGTETKLSYATLLAAALGRVALKDGDRVALDWFGGVRCHPVSTMGGNAAFDRLVEALEQGQVSDGTTDHTDFDQLLDRMDRRMPRGSVIVLFSDLLDIDQQAIASFARLSSRNRIAIAIRVLDPTEKNFSFTGSVRLRASEGQRIVETDAEQSRARYLEALESRRAAWADALIAAGGGLVDCVTSDDPVQVLREALLCARGRGA